MTLYDDLGVAKEATPEDIKKAYRDGSKSTHPDAGGDPAAFRQLTTAYKILSDEEKRARYDQGESAEALNGAVVSDEMQAHQLLAGVLGTMVDGADVNRQNVVALLQESLRNGIKSVDQEIGKAKKAEEKWQSFLRRLKNAKEDCPLSSSAKSNVASIAKGIAHMEQQRRVGERALQYLEDYGYEFDPPPPLTPAQIFAQQLQGATFRF